MSGCSSSTSSGDSDEGGNVKDAAVLSESRITPVPYVYESLPSEYYIRLVRIESVRHGLVKCSLFMEYHEPGLDERKYAALSYCCGDDPPSITIMLDGYPFVVTPNLHAAMVGIFSHLRQPQGESSPVWIDAICIDQDNYQEKSKQVQRMDQVYWRAARLLVWLGDETSASKRALRLAECLGSLMTLQLSESASQFKASEYSALQQYMSSMVADRSILISKEYDVDTDSIKVLGELFHAMYQARDDDGNIDNDTIASIMQELRTERHKLFSLDNMLWSDVTNLLMRPWFGRVWTFQEVVHASSDVSIISGRHAANWFTVNLLIRFVTSTPWMNLVGRELKLPDGVYVNTTTMARLARSGARVQFRGRELGRTLLAVLSRHARDPKDYVYGIVGLLRDDTRSAIQVDYDRSTAAVFCDALKAVCREEGTLMLLKLVTYCLLCLREPGEQPGTDRPSWCPNLANSRRIALDSLMVTHAVVESVQQMLHERLRPCTISEDGSRLTAHGVQIDAVKSVCSETLTRPPGREQESAYEDALEVELIASLTNGSTSRWLREISDILGVASDPSSHGSLRRWLETNVLPAQSSPAHGQATPFMRFQSLYDDARADDTGKNYHIAFDLIECERELALRVYHIFYKVSGSFFFVTEKGRIGLANHRIPKGAPIFYLGGDSLFAISPDESELITIVAVDGLMANLLFQLVESSEQWKELTLM